jgi:hypothetical protein
MRDMFDLTVPGKYVFRDSVSEQYGQVCKYVHLPKYFYYLNKCVICSI